MLITANLSPVVIIFDDSYEIPIEPSVRILLCIFCLEFGKKNQNGEIIPPSDQPAPPKRKFSHLHKSHSKTAFQRNKREEPIYEPKQSFPKAYDEKFDRLRLQKQSNKTRRTSEYPSITVTFHYLTSGIYIFSFNLIGNKS